MVPHADTKLKGLGAPVSGDVWELGGTLHEPVVPKGGCK